jgi:hypothetical protein
MPKYKVLYTITEEYEREVEEDTWEQACDYVYETPYSGERTASDIYIEDYWEVTGDEADG